MRAAQPGPVDRARSAHLDAPQSTWVRNAKLSGHADGGDHISYLVCQPEPNPSARVIGSAGIKCREEAAEAEQSIADTDGAGEQDDETAGFLVRQHHLQQRPRAESQAE